MNILNMYEWGVSEFILFYISVVVLSVWVSCKTYNWLDKNKSKLDNKESNNDSNDNSRNSDSINDMASVWRYK